MVLKFLGLVALVVTLVVLGLHKDGHVWVAAIFYSGCGAIVIGLIAAAVRRYF